MEFQEMLDASEDAEVALGITAGLLVEELFRYSPAPIFTQNAMRLKRIYDARLEQAERLRLLVESGGPVSAT